MSQAKVKVASGAKGANGVNRAIDAHSAERANHVTGEERKGV